MVESTQPDKTPDDKFDQYLEPNYKIIEVRTLEQIRNNTKVNVSLMDPELTIPEGMATITLAQAHYKTMGTQSLHAMLIVEMANAKGIVGAYKIHITSKDTMEELFTKRNIEPLLKALTNGNFLSDGVGIVATQPLVLQNKIKYHAKSPTRLVTLQNLKIMLGQVDKEKLNPPHFYLFSSHSPISGFRNHLRWDNFANNCIEWSLRMCTYAGITFDVPGKNNTILNTKDYARETVSFKSPGVAEMADFARAGNVEALEQYCKDFSPELINGYVGANDISSGAKERVLTKMTALHLACLYNQTEAVEWLMNHGAKPELKSKGFFPFMKLNAFECATADYLRTGNVFETIPVKRDSETTNHIRNLLKQPHNIKPQNAAKTNSLSSTSVLLTATNADVKNITTVSTKSLPEVKAEKLEIAPVITIDTTSKSESIQTFKP